MARAPTTRRRGGGPPRRTDHRTGSSPALARAVAAGLDGVEQEGSGAVTTFGVAGTTFLAVDDADASAVVRGPGGTTTLALAGTGRDEVRSAVEAAWAALAPSGAVAAHRRATAARAAEPALTHDDVRAVVATLPGANEGPVWGRDVGFRATHEKRSRFARFGPPEGSRVGNLLPPDDEGTLVLFFCEQKPELLAASPERFFTTPHYGPPDEPGGIVLRLVEQRGAAEHAEVAELLEDAWRVVAPPDRRAELDRHRTRSAP